MADEPLRPPDDSEHRPQLQPPSARRPVLGLRASVGFRRERGHIRRKALVTGGGGFIGSHLCELLLDDGWEVWALDDLSTGSLANVEHLSGSQRSISWSTRCSTVPSSANRPQVRRRLSPRRRRRRAAHRRAAGAHAGHESRGHRGRARALQPVREARAHRLDLRGVRRPPGRTPLEETARRVYGPTTQRRWAYADSKAMDEFLALSHVTRKAVSTASSRGFNTVGPRRVRPVRHGGAALRRAGARRRAAGGLRRRRAGRCFCTSRTRSAPCTG